MKRSSMAIRDGKNVMVDDFTGKLNLAQSLGLNTPFRGKEKLLQEMDDIRQAFSPEQLAERLALEKERERKFKASFDEWKQKDHLTQFKGIVPIADNHVIVKVFFYQELSDIITTDGGIILTDAPGTALESVHKILPVGIIVASSSESLAAGDLVILPATISKTSISAEWKQWQKDVREQPTLKNENMAPPMYIGMLSQWGQYIFQVNPFISIDDKETQHTFCIPERYVQSKLAV